MCIDCWVEFGSAAIDTPAVRAAARAVAEVYDHSCVGGHLHVLVDDWNLDATDSCARFIEENRHGSSPAMLAAERRCLELLRGLTEAERASALALHGGFWGTGLAPDGPRP
jgi:hypothetical protein